MKLIIAEKPSLGRNIANALNITKKHDGYLENEEYIVTWAFGHLFEIKDVDEYLGKKTKWQDCPLPFIPEKFQFALKKDKGIQKQFAVISALINRENVAEIINAGDSDREGQIIIDIILKTVGTSKKISRLWLPEQTEETIQKAVKNMQSNDYYLNLHNEGLARTYIDWLTGINLTRYVTIKSGELYPCGRVLIPIVKFIYDRDKAISEFVPVKYLTLESKTKVGETEVLLTDKSLKFSINELSEAENKCRELNSGKAKVISVEKKEIQKKPPKLFSLSKLQSELSKKHKISFANSLKEIQSLYESGLITYPRTNTEYLSENEKEKVQNIFKSFAEYPLIMKDNKQIFDDSKVESHSAIIPTGKKAELDGNQKIIYETVLRRFISNFYEEDCIIGRIGVKIALNDLIFDLKGESIVQKGFMEIEMQKVKNNLPDFIESQEFDVKFMPVEKTTSPPGQVTESSLSYFLKHPFKKNEELYESENNDDSSDYKEILKGVEIGTEATRTGIIENAKKYGYITQEKQSFNITKKGKWFIQTLEQLKINLFKEKTVELSEIQKKVFNGEKTISDAIEKVSKYLNEIISQDISVEQREHKEEKEIIGICPRCHKNIYEYPKSYSCSGYREGCRFTIWKKNNLLESQGKKLTKTMVKSLLSDGEVLVKGLKSKKGKVYDAIIQMVDTGEFVNYEMKFPGKN